MEKAASHSSRAGFFSTSFFSPSAWPPDSRVQSCECVLRRLLTGGTVADRWPFLSLPSDHVEHWPEIIGPKNGFHLGLYYRILKAQRRRRNLGCLCIILRWLKWTFFFQVEPRVFFHWSEMELAPLHRRGRVFFSFYWVVKCRHCCQKDEIFPKWSQVIWDTVQSSLHWLSHGAVRLTDHTQHLLHLCVTVGIQASQVTLLTVLVLHSAMFQQGDLWPGIPSAFLYCLSFADCPSTQH